MTVLHDSPPIITMKSTLSPRELALAIGVSESTLKRWIDAGRIDAQRTAGGHRRVPVEEAVRFLRRSGRAPEKPDQLGLFPLAGRGLDQTAEQFYELALAGRGAEACRLLLSAWVAGSELAELCDEVLAPTMVRVGEAWDGATAGVYVEHRATSIALQALDRLTPFLDLAPESGAAPVALGGAVAGDPSVLPSLMASAVLTSEGFRTVDLGANTPVQAFAEAVDDVAPTLVWMSVSYLADEARQPQEIRQLVARLTGRGVGVLLGGRVVGQLGIAPSALVRVGGSMGELVKLARELLDSTRRAEPRGPRSSGPNGSSGHGPNGSNGSSNGNGQSPPPTTPYRNAFS